MTHEANNADHIGLTCRSSTGKAWREALTQGSSCASDVCVLTGLIDRADALGWHRQLSWVNIADILFTHGLERSGSP